jgi:hypothetical protein
VPLHDSAARLIAALRQGDDLALAGLLNRDVRLVVDSGNEIGGETIGRARVIRALAEQLTTRSDASLHPVHVNGRPGVALLRRNGEVIGVLNLDDAEPIETLWLSTAPRKLAAWNRRRPEVD